MKSAAFASSTNRIWSGSPPTPGPGAYAPNFESVEASQAANQAAQTDAAIAASARGDALTTTLGYVQRRAALRDITNHI